ncbi:hypothetical protein L420_03758 [Enterobacter hormaechei subsp. hoffmannii UCICRE 9]|uniref:hypothetical protein n=1 Tax=Enterobacter hormaechei TaxID=158836 RepID=UPI0003BE86DF|nr:hypothetical protein [Enterobacter hormaechei]ESL86563.1 hypothetical protein L420_03758 [Enterobacter hormaechei subsp. hoffmannii UCICRE 9]
MSNIDKQAVQAVADLKAGYTLGHADVEIIQQMALDAVTLLDELGAKEKRTERALSLLNSANTDNVWDVIGRLKVVIGGDYRSESEIAAAAGKGE